jgi:hypothetical protein
MTRRAKERKRIIDSFWNDKERTKEKNEGIC